MSGTRLRGDAKANHPKGKTREHVTKHQDKDTGDGHWTEARVEEDAKVTNVVVKNKTETKAKVEKNAKATDGKAETKAKVEDAKAKTKAAFLLPGR